MFRSLADTLFQVTVSWDHDPLAMVAASVVSLTPRSTAVVVQGRLIVKGFSLKTSNSLTLYLKRSGGDEVDIKHISVAAILTELRPL